jgi:predicted nuclease of predicted toxin-antitoxin system
MRIVVDMNLSPQWIPQSRAAGHDAEHWSQIGSPRAPDTEIMQWARDNGAVVFTHDLDFGHALALTQADGPSVIQIRTQNISPTGAGVSVIDALQRFEQELIAGALVVIDEHRHRIRVLPLRK